MSALPKKLTGLTDKLAGKARSDERPQHLRPVADDGTVPGATEPGPAVQPAPPSLLERARSEFTPPDIWSRGRPSLLDVVNHGRYGQQVPDEGLARAAAKAWSWFAALNAAVAYVWQWVTERPSRTTIAVGLVVLASLVPTARAALTVLLWPAHTVIEILTDF
ncbi:hypothetical protein ACWGPQ_21930 [Saccharomonospora azurea]